MRRLALAIWLLGLCAAVGIGDSAGQEPRQESAKGKIRVLLTYGGHDFDEKSFFAMFDAWPDVVYTKAKMPQAADLLNPSLKKDYDVVVMYDMVPSLTPEQQTAFVELLNSGIGLVSLHHNIGANQDWDEFRKIIGGIHIPREFVVDGKTYGPSGATDDQTIRVTVADTQHPITRGIHDFTIHDETYHKYYTSPDVRVLLTTDHPKNEPPLAWVHSYGKSRVFYFMLGHDASAWQNPNYLKILINGIRWVAEKPEGVDAAFESAVRRIHELGGNLDFDSAGNLVGVDLASDRVSVGNADIPCLAALPHLRKLRLSGSGITAAGIDLIATMTGLTELSLLDAQLDSAGLDKLTRLADLSSLSVRRSPLTNDACLKHLRRFPKLTNLGLLEVGITDAGLAELAALTQLRLLDLRNCPQISNAGLQQLWSLPRLKVLRLAGYQIDDATLELIAGFDTLVGVTVEEAGISNAGLACLAKRPLEEINLRRCYGVTDEGLQCLQCLSDLRQLCVHDIPLTGDGLKCLKGKDKLTRLKLNGTGIDDAALKHLAGLAALHRLELGQTMITDAAGEILGGMKSLEYLDIAQTGISDAGAKRLADTLPQCKIVR